LLVRLVEFVKRTEWPQNSIDLNPLLLRLDGSAQNAKETVPSLEFFFFKSIAVTGCGGR
jgi:hypothetical protein